MPSNHEETKSADVILLFLAKRKPRGFIAKPCDRSGMSQPCIRIGVRFSVIHARWSPVFCDAGLPR